MFKLYFSTFLLFYFSTFGKSRTKTLLFYFLEKKDKNSTFLLLGKVGQKLYFKTTFFKKVV